MATNIGFSPDLVLITDYFPNDGGNRARRMFERSRFLNRQGLKVLVIAPWRDNVSRISNVVSSYIEDNPDKIQVIRVKPPFYKKYPSLKYQEYKANAGFIGRKLLPLLGYVRWVPPIIWLLVMNRSLIRNAVIFTPNNPVMLHVIGAVGSVIAKGWVAELRDPIVGYVSSNRGKYSLFDNLFESLVFKFADAILFRKGIEVDYSELIGRHPYAADKLIETPDYGVDLNDFHEPKAFADNKKISGIYAGNYYIDDTPLNLISAVAAYNQSAENKVRIDFYGYWDAEWRETVDCKSHGTIGYWDLLDKYAESDFVILFVPSTEQTRSLWVPSKLSELIATRLPILVVGDVESLPSTIVTKNRIGVSCRNEQKDIQMGLKEIEDMVLNATMNTDYFDEVKMDISNIKTEKMVCDAINDTLC